MTYKLTDLMADYLTNKIELVDASTLNTRLEICQGCEHLKKTFNVCGQCGCLVHEKAKHTKSSCPIGRW